MANPEHLALAKEEAGAIAEWRRENPDGQLDLPEANLSEANLSHADLSGANLAQAVLGPCDLYDANLSGAALSGADLYVANLGSANLSSADLSGALFVTTQLMYCNLSGANLSHADLRFAHFLEANLCRAKLSNAIFLGTSINGCDLSGCAGLDTIEHESSSSIDVDTLIYSFRGAKNRLTPALETFFRGAGVPGELLKVLPSIVSEIKYYTCFISYGEPDREFAEKLQDDLRTRGVDCWLYSKDYTAGEKSRREIGRQRRSADKMIVLCSIKALVRDNFKNEIEDQVDDDPDKIVPVCIDMDWGHEGFQVSRASRDLKPFLMEPNYVDFSHPARYEQSLERLLKGLERREQQHL